MITIKLLVEIVKHGDRDEGEIKPAQSVYMDRAGFK